MDTLLIHPSHQLLGVRPESVATGTKRVILGILSLVLSIILLAVENYDLMKPRRQQAKKEVSMKRGARRKYDSL